MSAATDPAALAASFAGALLDPGAACPAGLVTWNGSDAAQRFAVYRNNVTVSLVDAVADTFPVVRELVGDAFFAAMASEYVRRQPPASPVLAWYGETFADFVAAFPPAAGVPYLADMARLEYARVRAFHAADAPPLPAAALAERLGDPDGLPGLRLRLHPSLQTLVSPHAVVALWGAHQGEGDLAAVDPLQPESALVLRHGLVVEVVSVPEASARFVAGLLAGLPLGEAVAGAAGDASFDAAPALGLLIGRQLVVGLVSATGEEGDHT